MTHANNGFRGNFLSRSGVIHSASRRPPLVGAFSWTSNSINNMNNLSAVGCVGSALNQSSMGSSELATYVNSRGHSPAGICPKGQYTSVASTAPLLSLSSSGGIQISGPTGNASTPAITKMLAGLVLEPSEMSERRNHNLNGLSFSSKVI
ncbi:unnamed protein product [Protopolystoma xenopodis]|uniref:Uncharacterized protein n=1 Tax=Protopolystoma xenopodis TaxID=117903 RepID=A0A3S5A1L8_9PLAT|nr:unnamed protein product [Protopolystoma xenopodis]